MADLNDISLVTQVAVFHNKRAFDQLVRKYQSPVRRFFLNQTLGDEMLSDDLAQDTFIKAYVNITKFKGMSSFSTWLMRIAYNVFYDHVRASRPTEDIDTSKAVASKTASGSDSLKMDRRLSHRPDQQDHRDPRKHGEVASQARKRKNGKLLKRKWL